MTLSSPRLDSLPRSAEQASSEPTDLSQRLAAAWWAQERRAVALLLDLRGVIVGVRGAAEVIGHDPRSPVGLPIALLGTEEDRESGTDALEREIALSTGQASSDRWLVRSDGSRVWTTGTLTAIREDGRCIGFVKLLIERGDLQGRLETAKQRQAQLTIEKARLAGALGSAIHDLANPLAPLSTAVRMLSTVGPDKVGSLVPVIERQLAQVKRLLDELRAMQQAGRRPERRTLSTFPLQSVMSRVAQQFQPQADRRAQSVSLLLPAAPLLLHADEAQIAALLSPLLANALAFSPEGAPVWVSAVVEDDEVVLRVHDAGPGLDGARMEALQSWLAGAGHDAPAPSWLGTGLPLVRHLVRLQGGTVQVRSAGTGQGSEFIVRLPREVPRTTSAEEPAALGT